MVLLLPARPPVRYHKPSQSGETRLAIRGVIFDFGGVISNMRWDVARDLEREYDLERGTIFETFYDSDEWRAVQVGEEEPLVLQATAHRRLEKIAGRSLPPLHEQWRSKWGLIRENIRLIRDLRPSYKIAILSNADMSLEDRLRDGLGIDDLFDTVICSAVVGMAKPDHRIYKLTAERLELPTDQCVFIDDAEKNVEAAREVGMAAVHFRVGRGDNLADQLAELGVRAATAKA